VVGGEAGWNRGWGMLAGKALDVEKLEITACAFGIAQAAVEEAWAYAQERRQFGRAISAHQAVRHTLVEARTKLEACRGMLYRARGSPSNDRPCSVETSMAKLFVADTAVEIALACQRVMGAYGLSEGHDMERHVRDLLGMPIVGGRRTCRRTTSRTGSGCAARTRDERLRWSTRSRRRARCAASCAARRRDRARAPDPADLSRASRARASTGCACPRCTAARAAARRHDVHDRDARAGRRLGGVVRVHRRDVGQRARAAAARVGARDLHTPEVMLGGVFAPRGKAVAETGGFRVNGRWQWGSGTQNADWVMGGCEVIRDGKPELLHNGTPRSRMMIAPASEIEFFDTWYVSGCAAPAAPTSR
jgi:hypothetical protein